MKLAILLLVCAGTLIAQAGHSSVLATGAATVQVTPDMAKINISVTTTANTADNASSLNASITTNVISALTNALGPSGTVQTIGYSVNPNYNNGRVLTGFTVTNSIQAGLTDLTMTGKIVDTATQAGATSIDGLTFGLKDDSSAKAQALRAATVQAKSKADAMAASLNLKTGSVLAIQESGAVIQSIATPGVAATTPIQQGTVGVTGNVTLEVQLVQ